MPTNGRQPPSHSISSPTLLALAGEQLHIELAFRGPDLLGKRRLLHAEPLRGPA
jgi:hypothetical protein